MELMSRLSHLPGFAQLQSIRIAKGDGYLFAWAHRISGLLLLVYVMLHINTLASLSDPEAFTRRAQMFSGPGALLLEWLLAVPVIFHSLNGGRLLVYELFTTRYDKLLMPWVLYLSALYMAILGYLMVRGDQFVSAHFFWLAVLICSLLVVYAVFKKVRQTKEPLIWKLQRLSGALLFVMVPAHMVFMHLNHQNGREVEIISERIGHPLIIGIDLLLLTCVLFHGGYGLLGVFKDYQQPSLYAKIVAGGVIAVLAVFTLQGVMLFATG